MSTNLPTAPEALTKAITDLFEQGLIPDFESVEDWAENAYLNVARFSDDPTVKDILRLVEGTLFQMAQDAVGQEWDFHRNL